MARLAVGAFSVGLFLLLWQITGASSSARSDLISYPTKIAATFVGMAASGELGSNVAASLQEFIEGFLPAVAIGVAFGTVFALSPRFRYLVDPLFVALYSAPIIAFVPIIVLWFGVGPESKVAMVFLAAVVPIAINTTAGVNEISESWVRALRAFGANRSQIVLKAVLPGALPSIMTGIRLGIGRGIVSVVAAEMYVSMRGIGRLIQVYSTSSQPAEIFVLVIVISSFGLVCISALRIVERRMAPWRTDR
jgi:NitT/TauT family transport system permease protein